ncbi:unnamed protein product [Hermetia illucens]|uniref:Uncharacterized protein n=1 Tax=Hermetia illucens TaxID=343691 RepID=A0A7R8UFN0_HERIL|nr:unnamed protein product [Hermetia illucens]
MAGRPIQWPDTQRTHLQQSQRVLPVHTHTAKVPAPAPHQCPTVPRVCTTVQMILEQNNFAIRANTLRVIRVQLFGGIHWLHGDSMCNLIFQVHTK